MEMEQEQNGLEVTGHVKSKANTFFNVLSIVTLGISALGIALDIINKETISTTFVYTGIGSLAALICRKANNSAESNKEDGK
ncbi:MAG: hypothetical protein FWE80_03870 [Oscillospiraceae bacterium]|nr:hypothetical protein [Oscillospiraceae bacterium]